MKLPTLSELSLLATLGASACMPELKPSGDQNGSEIGETCTSIGINPNLADNSLPEDELLASYGADFATRVSIKLSEGSHYISGEVTHADTNEEGIFTCMTGDPAAPCEVDLYTENTQACADLAGNWVVSFNETPGEVTCWYIGRDGTDPNCTLEGSELSIEDPNQ